MTDIIDLKAEIEKRNGPDPQHVRVIDGVKWFEFSASFTIDGRTFCHGFWAKDEDDAKARVKAMRKTMKLDGQIYLQVDG